MDLVSAALIQGHDQINPDMLNPPSTDHGTLPNLRFSFADSHVRQESGGWTRQITERELGVSKSIAGVNMRLNAGGIRAGQSHFKIAPGAGRGNGHPSLRA